MTLTKTVIISGIIALVVSGVAWASFPAKTSHVSFGNTSVDGSQSNLPNPSNSDYAVARLALGLGTNLSNSNTGVGNVIIEAQKMVMNVATGTPCAIQNPLSATSTVLTAGFNITTSTSTAGSLTIATSSTAFATTSPVFGAIVPANVEGTYVGGETASSTGLGIILGPSSWVVFGVAGATGGYTYGGTCSITVQSV